VIVLDIVSRTVIVAGADNLLEKAVHLMITKGMSKTLLD
jgi:hypothetical protein